MSKNDKKRRDGDDDLEEMRQAFRQDKERQKGGGGTSKNDWDKLDKGKNMRRVLPRPGERKFYTEGWTHFDVGPNKTAVRCIDEARIDVKRGLPQDGTRCPLCKKFLARQAEVNSEYAKGDEDGQREWKKAKDRWAARKQYYCNVLVPDDDGESVEVKILAFGTQVWRQLLNFYLGDDTSIGDFTDPTDGRWMNIKKVDKGGRDRRNVGYEVYPASESDDISDSWADIKEMLHDLEAACGQLRTREDVLNVMKGINADKESADDDDDDRASDRGSGKRRRRDRDEDDSSGEDEDEEDSDDDADDDDDDRPVKVKGSKLAAKMKKRRERDDD